ncbi:hypothetical protein ABZW18_15505 [Streptomyces sp. NPDC004647]|uniref:hypothetical protein n=1 Tax=Streptomyces sp. NPDC004647 TaxID=3154671 RepID=UPI0033B5E192
MGIESDQLVYDYLSRVGDLAQQRQLPSGDRMRLVSKVRTEIEQQRAGVPDTPAAVKRILGKLGPPSEVVDAAGGPVGGASAAPAEPAEPPAARSRFSGFAQRTGLGGRVPAPRQDSGPVADTGGPPLPAFGGASPPHLAGEDELGPSDARPDWWRLEPGPFGSPGESVPGFTGGIEIPEILKPPRAEATEEVVEAAEAEEAGAEAVRGPGLLRRVISRRRKAAAVEKKAARAMPSPLLLLAAGFLVVGAVLGNLIALGLGWVIAYGTRQLSRAEAKWAALGLPGLVAASAVLWLWGRVNGRWGEPIPHGGMGDALLETWPVAVRTAAAASALYLVWRARRRQ